MATDMSGLQTAGATTQQDRTQQDHLAMLRSRGLVGGGLPTMNTATPGTVAAPTAPSAQPQFSVASPTREAIDPADRGTRLSFEGFQIPTMTPERVTAPTVGPVGQLDPSGFQLDPSQFGAGGQFGFDVGRIGSGFRVNPQSVMEQAMETFRSQLPSLNLDLMDATEGLAKNTAALGRTGSGLFNRDTDELSDRARATRESLLGNIGLQAATTDAGNDLQAQIATGGFGQQGLGRLLQAQLAGGRNALEASLANQGAGLRAGEFNIGNELRTALANQGAGLQAGLANQGAGNQAQQFNINNALQGALEQMGLAERQQGREDRLASEANRNLFAQLGLLGQGFQGDPTSALNMLAQTQSGAGQEFGANAGAINNQIAQLGGFTGDMLAQHFGRPRIPNAPAPIQAPGAPEFGGIAPIPIPGVEPVPAIPAPGPSDLRF